MHNETLAIGIADIIFGRKRKGNRHADPNEPLAENETRAFNHHLKRIEMTRTKSGIDILVPKGRIRKSFIYKAKKRPQMEQENKLSLCRQIAEWIETNLNPSPLIRG